MIPPTGIILPIYFRFTIIILGAFWGRWHFPQCLISPSEVELSC